MKYKAPRGTHDLWGTQADKLYYLEDMSRKIFKKNNYTEIKLPTFEDASLFTRSIGYTTDIVEKEMYVFTDRKGRKLALRPEGTASVVRSYLENQLSQKLSSQKIFYAGSMFRYERPQAGRYREFFQIGAEYFNNSNPSADAEIILVSKEIIESFGINNINIHLHTLGCQSCRQDFRKALKKYFSPENKKLINELCGDCQRRIVNNPLRLLDCKIDGNKFSEIPRMEQFLCEECRKHFEIVKDLLNIADCKFNIDHRLVRGLDYYTRTIFEIRGGDLGSQDALAAGGRYDNLVEELGGPKTPAVGFALGSERVIMAAENMDIQVKQDKMPIVFIAVTGQELEKEAFKFAVKQRKQPSKELFHTNEFIIEGPYSDKSLKSQLRLADKIGADKVIIFGQEEFARSAVTVRDMKTQSQQEVKLEKI